jgi:hypothetical protein
MPSLTASLTLDATSFNAAAARVTERTKTMGDQMSKVGFSKGAIDSATSAERMAAMRGELIRSGFSPAAAAAALKADEMAKGADKAARSTSALGGAVKMMAGYMSVGFVTSQVSQIAEYADKVGGLSERLGMSAESVQAWDQALKLSNSSIDTAVPFLERLSVAKKKAMEGDKDMIASFAKLGVGISQLQSQNVESLALTIGKAFEGGSPEQLISDLRNVGGKGAGAMIEAFTGGLADMVQRNRNSWAVMSQDAVDSIKTAKDEVEKMKMTLQGLGGALIGIEAKQFNAKLGFYQKLLGAGMGGVEGVLSNTAANIDAGMDKGAGGGIFRALSGGVLGLLTGQTGLWEGIKKGWQGAGDDGKPRPKGKPFVEGEAEPPPKSNFGKMLAEHNEEKAKLERENLADEARQKQQAAIDAQREKEREAADLAKMGQHKLSSRQQMGGFGIGGFAASGMTYGPEQAAQNTRQKMAGHLENIEKLFKQRGKTWDSSSKTVEF